MALTAQQVQQFYIGYYGRPADPVGLAYWQTQDEATALKGFSESAEFTNQFTGLSASQQVTKVYNNLLGRAPDTAGLLYWAGELTAGRETIGSLVLSMTKNALGKDVTTIEDRVTYSNAFTTALNTAEEINAYAGTAATQAARDALLKVVATAVGDHTALNAETAKIDATIASIVSGGGSNPGQTFTLTTGIDNLTGTSGNDTFTAVFSAVGTTTGADGTSFNTADIVDGGAGTDTISYIVMGDANGKGAANTVVPANLKNIEAFTVRNLATDSTPNSEEVHTLDLASVTGVTGVTNKASTAGVTFNNIGKSASVTVDAVVSGNTTFTRGAASITDALTINIANGVKAGQINSNDGNNDATAVTINSTGAKNVVGTMNVTGTATVGTHTATSVTINAATDLTIGTADGTADLTGFDTTKAGTITVTGAGNVVLNDLAGVVKTLNAGSSTGGVTATGLTANLQEVTGGAGKDSITLGGALNDKGFVKLGAGNDTLNIGANAVNAGAVVDLGAGDDSFLGTGAVSATASISGGDGKDTLAATLVTATNVAAFSGFENLDLKGLSVSGGLDADLFAAKNTIEKLVLSGDAGATNAIINNVAAGVGLEITASSANAVTIGQKGVTAGGTVVDKFTATFNAAASDPVAAKTVTVAGVTLNSINEVTIVSDGGEKVSNVLTSLVSDEMKTLNITGDNALTLTNLYSAGTTKTAVLTTIDASGQVAGGLKMALGAVNGNLTVKLGGGDDVITAGFNTTGGSLAADSTAAGLDKITNFNKATDAELTAATGYDLVKLVDANGSPVTYAIAGNATGTTTAAGINNGVVSFASLTTGPQNFADAVAKAGAVVATAGNAAIFEYGANSYLYVDVDGSATTTNDLVIELTGVTGATKLGILTDSLYVM